MGSMPVEERSGDRERRNPVGRRFRGRNISEVLLLLSRPSCSLSLQAFETEGAVLPLSVRPLTRARQL
jgi:hypothetical protein